MSLSGITQRINPVHWKISSKIVAIVITVVLLSVMSLTIYTYLAISRSSVQNTGQVLISLGNEVLERSAQIMMGHVNNLQTLALSPAIYEAVNRANQANENKDKVNLTAEITTLDQQWQNEAPEVAALVEQIAAHPVSEQLRTFMAAFPDEVEVFVTDKQGLIVAMTERTGDYLQADEEWWVNTFNNGQGAIYIGQVEYDDSSKTWAINIGIPIKDNEQVIGVLRGTVNISSVFEILSKLVVGQTGHATLLDKNGVVIYTPNAEQRFQPAPQGLAAVINTAPAGFERNLADMDGNPAVVAFNHLEGQLGELLGWAIVLDQDIAEVEGPVRQLLLGNLLVAGVIILVLGGAGALVARSIAAPLKIVTHQARQLSEGDITAENSAQTLKYMNRRDETGDLLRAFSKLRDYSQEMADTAGQLANGDLTVGVKPHSAKDALGNDFARMIVNLRDLIGAVADNADQVNLASRQLSTVADQASHATNQMANTIQQVATGAAQQSASVAHTANSVDQMSRAIEGVAQGAQEQAAAIARSSAVTGQIAQAIEQVSANVKRLETMREMVGSSTLKVGEMGKRSKQIGAIVETIDEIASQTNLLALNAAIEAARAGEHGKGFAVVADEVRKLAEKSATATKEIAQLVQTVQTVSQEAGTAMENTAAEVDRQVEELSAATREMSDSSNELVEVMETVSAVVEENTASTEEMAAGSAEVSQAIEAIASVSQENSAAVEEVSAGTEEMTAQVDEVSIAAQKLNQLAQSLQSMVNRFKLDS